MIDVALAMAVCVFLGAFWTLRLVAAALVLDVRPYLTSGWYRTGYHATNVVFSLLPVVYFWAAWEGMRG
jgi:isoprenylcysteine carboxyl methyltransferase (ICMT) family protein YpbQ